MPPILSNGSQILFPSSKDVNKKIPITKIRDSEAGGLPCVKNEDFFHGFMPKEQTERLLVRAGDFLLRQAVKGESRNSTSVEQFTISVRVKERTFDVDPINNESDVMLGVVPTNKSDAEIEVDSLIEYHKRHHLPIDDEGTIIKKPVKRAEWQLNHEQLIKSDCDIGGEMLCLRSIGVLDIIICNYVEGSYVDETSSASKCRPASGRSFE
uniref:SH2 domain-containing protein n=1 Tax=Heterorhabditis bacteriophora TaxID=37862 RepID=A0A1I7WNB6_HETBA